MVKTSTIITVVAIVAVICIGWYALRKPCKGDGGWHCTEEGCKFIAGEPGHTTEKGCMNSCSKKDHDKKKKVSFSPEV